MSEFEELVGKLLEQKPDLTRQEIDEKIKHKKDQRNLIAIISVVKYFFMRGAQK